MGIRREKEFPDSQSVIDFRLRFHLFLPAKKLILACDASLYEIGAVLSQRMDNGTNKPVTYSSCTLVPAKKKYSQIEKEGLAIIFGVKRFHQYLFGRQFTILSDHKSLKHLFGESWTTPTLALAHIQRWSLTLEAYDYTIQYKPGKQHSNANMLSWLPLPEIPSKIPVPGETILLIDSYVKFSSRYDWTFEAIDSKGLFCLKSKTWYSRGGRILVTQI